MFEKIKKLYAKLPDEVTIFIEYIFPSVVITALIDYLSGLEINNVYVSAVVNLVLIFLRQVKPRFLKK